MLRLPQWEYEARRLFCDQGERGSVAANQAPSGTANNDSARLTEDVAVRDDGG